MKNITEEMKQIDTLVFDYGGVLVNIDDGQVVRALKSLGLSSLKQLLYARKIKRLMHQFIDGLVPEDETLDEMQKLCRKGTTKDAILYVLDKLCGNLPIERMQALVGLRQRYKYPILAENLERVLCNRVHFKIIVIDCEWVYVGSANLTGAGMGMKSPHKRNFEAGIFTDAPHLVDGAMEEFDRIWRGEECKKCGRKEFCIDRIK